MLLARLAHHLLLWGKQWLSRVPTTRRRLQGYGLVRLLRACSQKTRSPLFKSDYPRSDAHLTGTFRGAGAGCLPEILQLPPPEEGHLLQRTAPLPTAVVRSPRGWPGYTPNAAHHRPAAGVYAARHKPA